MKNKCEFCQLFKNKIIGETNSYYLKWDDYPVTEGHILIISKEHKANYSELSEMEKIDLTQAIDLALKIIKAKFNVVDVNIGINQGTNAGQSVFHFHCHVIPRRNGDVEKPKGGVRGVIPNKQSY